MPVHDWTKVDAGLFHNFHQLWTVALCNALNSGVLPGGYFALIEQKTPDKEPDLLTLRLGPDTEETLDGSSGLAVATAPPRTHITCRNEVDYYAAKANRITVRHRHGDAVGVIELVSPGNKSGKAAFKEFVDKAVSFIQHRIHFLVIDLFPPTPSDPMGVHKAIWDEFDEADFDLPADRPMLLASYDAGPPQTSYVETIGVGKMLPAMTVFLRPEYYVPAPLEETYQQAWAVFPAPLKKLLER